jgi:Glycosyl transferase family 11
MLAIAAKSGFLGNRLLVFSHFIAFAIDQQDQVVNLAFDEYAQYFKGTVHNPICRYPALPIPLPSPPWLRRRIQTWSNQQIQKDSIPQLEIRRDRPFNWSNSIIQEQYCRDQFQLVHGWLYRDGWYLDEMPRLAKHRSAIVEYFQPLDIYQERIDALIQPLRDAHDLLIGIHIRRGDYQGHQGGRYFYDVDDYVNLMRHLVTEHGDRKVHFLICSNETIPADQLTGISYSFGLGDLIEDLYSLSACDYLAGPPSTFSMWASFYGDRPLYMMIDPKAKPDLSHFVHCTQWQGQFHANEDWSKTFWEWTDSRAATSTVCT